MPNKKLKAKKPINLIIVTFCILAWGSSYVAIKIGLNDFSPSQVAAYRFFVAGIISLVWMCCDNYMLPNRKQWFQIVGVAFFGIFLYHIAITYFTVHYRPNVVSFVSNTAPIFMIIFAHWLLTESLQNIRWSGFWIALLGIAIMNVRIDISFDWKHLGILSIPISGALFFVLQKPLLGQMKPTQMMHLIIIIGAIMLLIWDFSFITAMPSASFESHFAIIFLGVVPTFVAFQLWSYLLSGTKVSSLSSPIYLVPSSTLLFSFLFLNQIPQTTTILGGILTILGVAISKRKLKT